MFSLDFKKNTEKISCFFFFSKIREQGSVYITRGQLLKSVLMRQVYDNEYRYRADDNVCTVVTVHGTLDISLFSRGLFSVART